MQSLKNRVEHYQNLGKCFQPIKITHVKLSSVLLYNRYMACTCEKCHSIQETHIFWKRERFWNDLWLFDFEEDFQTNNTVCSGSQLIVKAAAQVAVTPRGPSHHSQWELRKFLSIQLDLMFNKNQNTLAKWKCLFWIYTKIKNLISNLWKF